MNLNIQSRIEWREIIIYFSLQYWQTFKYNRSNFFLFLYSFCVLRGTLLYFQLFFYIFQYFSLEQPSISRNEVVFISFIHTTIDGNGCVNISLKYFSLKAYKSDKGMTRRASVFPFQKLLATLSSALILWYLW